MGDITKKQLRFIEEYLIDLNMTQAAIRAGYSPDSAGNIGHELMKKPEIRARVDKAMAERSKRVGINADRVLRELGRLAFVNPRNVIDFQTAEVREGAGEDDIAAIAGMRVKYVPHKGVDDSGAPVVDTAIEREVKLCDKLKALELCGKHLGMFEKGADNDALEKLDKILEGIDRAAQP
ncbi:terminase small subunit [Intestinibacillus massiliensis]|uniref:terminase small subunit n=1 Tax=Intestinibacillus massiliensis TaxID=1871029 RepID=UPI001F470649|nr:terminase small subunit [Intestinibacillus massiliensis]